MNRPSPAQIALFAIGLAVRLWSLPLPGTIDTKVWKTWSAHAVRNGVSGIFGPPDKEVLEGARQGGGLLHYLSTSEVHRRQAVWGDSSYTVDYPPGSILILWAEGRLYSIWHPELDNSALFSVCINLASLLGSLAIAILLKGSAEGQLGWTRALAFWCNPAILLACVLGYQDTVFGAFALGAVMALMARRYVLATTLVVVSGLVKPQGALVVPTLLAVLFLEAGPKVWIKAALGGALASIVILSPWWMSGYLIASLNGGIRSLTEPWLSSQGLNVWWICGYLLQWAREGPWPFTQTMWIRDFQRWARFDPLVVSRALQGLGTLFDVGLLLCRLGKDRVFVPLAILFQVHLYALLGNSVHENHAYLALIVAMLLLGRWPYARTFVSLASGVFFLNLFLMEGLGRGVFVRVHHLKKLRMVVGLDLSIVTALVHVTLFGLLILWMLRSPKGSTQVVEE